jgi:hypothetical protein
MELHYKHIDDLMFEPNGFEKIETILTDICCDRISVNIKWDGNPAVFFGKCPKTEKFFVATKQGLTSKSNPRICYSLSDVEKFYKDTLVYNALSVCFNKFVSFELKNIYHVDMLFTDLKELVIIKNDGKRYLSCSPNLITYGVEINKQDLSSLYMYDRILDSDFGMVVHSTYDENFNPLGDGLNANLIYELLRKTDNVFILPNTFIANAILLKIPNVVKDTLYNFCYLDRVVKKINEEVPALKNYILKYINEILRNGRFLLNWSELYKEFGEILYDKCRKDNRQKGRIIDFFDNHSCCFADLFNYIKILDGIKEKIILEATKCNCLKPFILDDGLYKPFLHEGLLVDVGGELYKIVCREKFTMRLFDLWKKYILLIHLIQNLK